MMHCFFIHGTVSVTRWARGTNANKKKPFEASDWSEMKTVKKQKVLHDSSKSDKAHEENESVQKGKHKLEDVGIASKLKVPKKTVPLPAIESAVSLIDELERPKMGAPSKKDSRLDTLVLEEFVRKDRRRENRRVKRQETKMTSRVCFNCREQGHDLASCPRVVQDVDQGTGVCFKCGSTEHKIQQCRAKVPQGKFPFAKCFICGETGHLSRSCPDNPKGLYPNGGCCNECGSVEHFKRDCPELQKLRAISDTTLPTLDSRTNVEELPSLTPTIATTSVTTKKVKVVKF